MSRNRDQLARFDEARQAGMTAVQAARWVAYVEKKTAAGEDPIELWEAVLQLQAAHDEARVDRLLRRMFADMADELRSQIVWESA